MEVIVMSNFFYKRCTSNLTSPDKISTPSNKKKNIFFASIIFHVLIFFVNQIQCKNHTVTLSMIVKNEANRYIEKVLQEVKNYIDAAVIIDDHSTDNTIEICKKILSNVPLTIIQNHTQEFEKSEAGLRQLQWETAISSGSDWILGLDADEVPEKKFGKLIKAMINNENAEAYSFRLYDFWDQNHYREDRYWCAHLKSTFIFLIKYIPTKLYTWSKKNLHCGRWPLEIYSHKIKISHTNLRIKHLGWANPNDRINKYNRYMRLDPKGEFGCLAQYRSILNKKPNLKKWVE